MSEFDKWELFLNTLHGTISHKIEFVEKFTDSNNLIMHEGLSNLIVETYVAKFRFRLKVLSSFSHRIIEVTVNPGIVPSYERNRTVARDWRADITRIRQIIEFYSGLTMPHVPKYLMMCSLHIILVYLHRKLNDPHTAKTHLVEGKRFYDLLKDLFDGGRRTVSSKDVDKMCMCMMKAYYDFYFELRIYPKAIHNAIQFLQLSNKDLRLEPDFEISWIFRALDIVDSLAAGMAFAQSLYVLHCCSVLLSKFIILKLPPQFVIDMLRSHCKLATAKHLAALLKTSEMCLRYDMRRLGFPGELQVDTRPAIIENIVTINPFGQPPLSNLHKKMLVEEEELDQVYNDINEHVDEARKHLAPELLEAQGLRKITNDILDVKISKYYRRFLLMTEDD